MEKLEYYYKAKGWNDIILDYKGYVDRYQKQAIFYVRILKFLLQK